MRKYIRHPSNININFKFNDDVKFKKKYLNNVSHGGLCFSTDIYIKPGSKIHIQIKIHTPPFHADGLVAWCKKKDITSSNNHYDVGIQFIDAKTEFAIRMVEQVCYIEKYKRDVLEKEGRKLTGEEAAVEWIKKYAKKFPK